MSQYKIERDVPMPPRSHVSKYPFLDMEPGDSVLIPDAAPKTLIGSVQHARLKTGGKFAMRPVDGGVRVWRRS